MASIVLSVVGGVAGGIIGGPAGASLGMAIGGTVGGIIDMSLQKTPVQYRGKLDDLRVTGSQYGAVIPQAWGKVKCGGNIIWASDLIERRRSQTIGGKGGPSAEQVTYSYFANVAVSICAGPISWVEKIWADDLLVYDRDATPATKFDISLYTGTESQNPDPLMESFEGAGNVPAYRGMAYAVFSMFPLRKFGNRIPNFSFEVRTAEEVSVATVAGDLFQQAGLLPSQFNGTGGASRNITGFLLESRQPARDAVETLLRVTGVDITEVDGLVTLVARGGNVEVEIPEEDLGAVFFDEGSEAVSNVRVRRVQEFELPGSVEVTYMSSDKGYEVGSQLAVRYTKPHVAEKLTINTPLILSDTRARQYAEFQLYRAWLEREEFEITLPPAYLRYTPGTVVTIPVDGDSVRCRIVSQDYAVFGPIQTMLVRDDTNILTQTVEGGSLGDIDETLANPETIEFIPFCSNALIDEHADSIGCYLMAAGQESWGGVQVYMARSGNAYRPVEFLGDSATYGTAETELDPGTGTGIIEDTYIDVELQAGSVETVSMEELLAGSNAAMLGEEVIGFQTVEALGANTYRLSGLLRGQRGTDYAWDGHAVGERFFVLDSATIARLELPRGLLNKTVKFKAITEFEELADVDPVELEITGQELKPYSPVHVTGERDGSDNLTIEWVRRVRKNNDLFDGEDVELDEPHERYKVEVWDSTYTTLERTISVSAPTATYTAAQQVTDFGSTQPVVYIRVYQLGDFAPGTTTSRMDGYAAQVAV
jgi:hypothetical protein